MGVLSDIGGLVGLDKASGAQDDALADAMLRMQEARVRANKMLEPFSEAGQRSLESFEGNIGNQPNYADTIKNLRFDPGYQFELQRGMDALEGGAAARGNLQSGNTLKALMDFGQGLAATRGGQAFDRKLNSFNNQQNQLLNLLNFGFDADRQRGANALRAAGVAGDLGIARGNVKANRLMGMSEGIGGLLDKAASAAMGGAGGGPGAAAGGAQGAGSFLKRLMGGM